MSDTLPERLDAAAISHALEHLPDWKKVDDSIERSLTFNDFSAAFGFMTRVAMLCEAQNHHPDWSNAWNQVSIRLSTHECGGLSHRDIELAASIEQLLQSGN